MSIKLWTKKLRIAGVILSLTILGVLSSCASMFASQVPAASRAGQPAPSGARLDVKLPAIRCAALADIDLSDIGGNGSYVAAAVESVNNGVTVCEVSGTLAPSIGFKVSLPTKTWTQRYLQVGCGGLCGRISLEVGAAQGCVPLTHGEFVLASTDMGHQGMDNSFGDDPQKRADFAHRGVHLTAVAAKKLIGAFYGQKPAYAYFTGCSDGGREALIEAQRYPEDFNGIIAGAAAMNFQVQNALYHAWQARSNQDANGKAIVVASRLPLLHKAVLQQCDGLDGQNDQLISDPRACHFNPSVVQCKASQNTADCLTPQEVQAVRLLYDGPRDPATGERLTMGGPQPGSELAWAGVFVPASADQPINSEKMALDALRNLAFEHNPGSDFSLSDLRFDRSTFDRLRPLHRLYDATNPNLAAFADQGGKLILWHGWADPHISPLNTLAYHEAVQAQMGKARTEAFERLYLLPGVYHCSGGEGPSLLDLLTPMMAWVEKSQPPAAIVTQQASKQSAESHFGAPSHSPTTPGQRPERKGASPAMPRVADAAEGGRSRPVYPYPSMATYDQHGDPQLTSSYVRGPSLVTEKPPAWMGADFFRPYTPLQR